MELQEMHVEVPHRLAQLAKCAHEGCTCTVETGEQYCGDYCAEMANADHAAAEHDCGCGHPECEESTHLSRPLTTGREGS